MFDAAIRPWIDPPLSRVAKYLVNLGVTADQITVVGFAMGMFALPALAFEHYVTALSLIIGNRILDGLDGAVARETRASDRGGFLDIALDFLFYAGVVFGFALVNPENALPAAFLLMSFIGTSSSFLAYASIAAKRGLITEKRGKKSLYYLGGLTEGTETILFFTVICWIPQVFPIAAWIFGSMCLVTTATRILQGWQDFGD